MSEEIKISWIRSKTTAVTFTLDSKDLRRELCAEIFSRIDHKDYDRFEVQFWM